MDSRKIVLQETAVVALGEAICCGVMIGVYAAIGYFELRVLWAALAGFCITVANYFFMAMVASLAVDRAEKGETAQAKKMIRLSMVIRFACLGLAVFVAYKLGINGPSLIALALPLLFVRPVLLVKEFFRKKGDWWTELM